MMDEEKIVWVEDPTGLRFLREAVAYRTRRSGRLGLGFTTSTLYGWVDAAKGTKDDMGGYQRRFWFLKEHDDMTRMDKMFPCEAVDPQSIVVNRESKRLSGPLYVVSCMVEHSEIGFEPFLIAPGSIWVENGKAWVTTRYQQQNVSSPVEMIGPPIPTSSEPCSVCGKRDDWVIACQGCGVILCGSCLGRDEEKHPSWETMAVAILNGMCYSCNIWLDDLRM